MSGRGAGGAFISPEANKPEDDWVSRLDELHWLWCTVLLGCTRSWKMVAGSASPAQKKLRKENEKRENDKRRTREEDEGGG